jgi:tetratricopeptide (TPR) repeat protein
LKKQQFVLVGSGVVLFCLIFFFGRTVPHKKPISAAPPSGQETAAFDIQSAITAAKQQLTPSQQEHITQLESAVVRGNVKEQQTKVYHQLADFWKDSAHALLPYAYYIAEAAKLENSEKSLTFAAHFYLDGVRSQDDPAMKKWMATEAKDLFEKALVLNPTNDSLKVGLGSTYLFGNITDNPMQGIMMLREVAERDPKNMYAQLMLGIGGMISGQLDKAIERLNTVVSNEPSNAEAMLMLAEAYERKGDKEQAISWYKKAKNLITTPEVTTEIDHRIELLKK